MSPIGGLQPLIMKSNILITLAALAALASSSSAETTPINWAGSINPGSPNALGAPDGIITPIGDAIQRQLGDFLATPTLSYTNLSIFLGVSPTLLAQADIIAFEGNGGAAPAPNFGWESTRFTLSDGANLFVIDHDETLTGLAPGVLATGQISFTNYSTFFPAAAGGSDAIYSFILLDAPSNMNVASPSFTVDLKNGANIAPLMGHGEGTPDPDAIGVINIPEPTSGLLALLGAGLCLRRRTSRNA